MNSKFKRRPESLLIVTLIIVFCLAAFLFFTDLLHLFTHLHEGLQNNIAQAEQFATRLTRN